MSMLHRIMRRLLPRGFRDRHGRDLVELHQDMGRVRGRFAKLRSRARVLYDLVLTGICLRWEALRGSAQDGYSRHANGRSRALLLPLRVRHSVAIQSFWQDIRHATRTLHKRRLFTTVAVLTIGLGIGATTAMFSVVDGVLLRSLPYERPGELVTVWETMPEWLDNEQLADMWDTIYLAYPDFVRWRDDQTMFEDVAIYGDQHMTLTGRGTPERLLVGLASSSLLQVLRVQPLVGRFFGPEEEGLDAAAVVVLSFGFWEERFGRDTTVLGESISLNGRPFTVVGVLPYGFQLRQLGIYGEPGRRPIWIPVGADGANLDAGNHAFEAVSRLRDGTTLAQATGETEVLLRGDLDPSRRGARLLSRDDAETHGLRAPLTLLLGAAVVLLLIACGNVSTLLMSEAPGRRREILTRAALGADRKRIVRLLLAESVLLGLLGCAIGTLFALVGTRVLVSMAPDLPRLDEVGVNGTVLLFAVFAGVTTGILFGLGPSLGLSRIRLHGVLQRCSQEGTGRTWTFPRVVVAAEFALTVALLASGGLLIRSLANLLAVDPGFRQEHLCELRVELPWYRQSMYYADAGERLARLQEIRTALEAVPGVLAASGTSAFPFTDTPGLHSFTVVGAERGVEEPLPHAVPRSVLPGYFEVFGIRLLEGRTILETDDADAPRIAVISESAARRFWPGVSPLNHRLVFGDTLTVVGVVGDVLHEALDSEIMPTMYAPAAQRPPARMSLVVKTALKPQALFPQLREAIWRAAPDIPITRTTTVASLVAQSTKDERFRTLVLGAFGICAAVLAAVGVSGVTARSVIQKRRELGIRMALGAQQRGLVGSLVRVTLSTCIAGTAFGLVGAFWVSHVLTRFLFGVEPSDPATYGTVGIIALLMCLTAAYLPARRITSVDPVEVLRAE